MSSTITGTTPREILTKRRRILIYIESYALLIFSFGVILSLSLFSYDSGDNTKNLIGPFGNNLAWYLLMVFGASSFLIPAGFLYAGILLMLQRNLIFLVREFILALAILISLSVLIHLVSPDWYLFDRRGGGQIGEYAGEVMRALFSTTGSVIITLTMLFCAILMIFRKSALFYTRIVAAGGGFLLKIITLPFISLAILLRRIFKGETRAEEVSPLDSPVELKAHRSETPPTVIAKKNGNGVENQKTADSIRLLPDAGVERESGAAITVREHFLPKIVETPRKRHAFQEEMSLKIAPSPSWRFQLPPVPLLDVVPQKDRRLDQELLHKNAEKLERKLLDYNVEGKVVEIHPGPVVTMYEFLPAPGVKIVQIANLSDDLAMTLKAMSIRIVAPIPGKDVIGIEIPNEVRETVYLREIIADAEFKKSRSKLTLALGKDIFGNPAVADLARMPHLLVAGATGSGKSVIINAFILSLLYNATPDEVRIILVDPKVVELQQYEGIPHLLLPVVSDSKQAALALKWAVDEMERRYRLMRRLGVNAISSYNQKIAKMLSRETGVSRGSDTEVIKLPDFQDAIEVTGFDEFGKIPYIVVILDEFADLMIVASKEVETAVQRLAQKARAAGIHLIMATQRPSKEVITGLIKANFTSRISFRVASKVDSRVILDTNGAENLLGMGDMLFMRPGISTPQRFHSPFVSEDEVKRVTDFLKAQGKPQYDLDILADDELDKKVEEVCERDDLYHEAVQIVLETRRASISYLQRRLKVGYNRAARMIEQMELDGIVGPPDSKGERQVL